MKLTKKESLQGIEGIKFSKKIGNNTFEIIYNNGNKAIRLHKTNIITYLTNGNFILNSGGWKTLTTKERINKYLPSNLRLSQKNHHWSLIQYDKNYTPIRIFTYFDNIILKPLKVSPYYKIVNSNLLKDKYKTGELKSNQSIAKIKKQIKTYVNLLDKIEKIPLPSNGDCWYCSMKTQSGETLGDTTKDKNHLENHLKENYIFGSIVYNAVIEAGYKYPQLIVDTSKGSTKRALRKYLIKRLILK